jgi:hypothetical protein
MTKITHKISVVLTTLTVLLSFQGWASSPTIGSKSAVQGGVFYLNLDGEPDSLHPIMSSDAYSRLVM